MQYVISRFQLQTVYSTLCGLRSERGIPCDVLLKRLACITETVVVSLFIFKCLVELLF